MAVSFVWGAATSAHQVEGGNEHNQWWAWERGRPAGFHSGQATDHYHRFAEDFQLAAELGHTAHRLSLEWSRLEVAPGSWSRAVFDHYRAVLQELRRLHLQSFVTLHHFTNPIWFERQGGWHSSGSPEQFANYVQRVIEELGDLVDVWITFNEPLLYAWKSYRKAEWPPHEGSWLGYERVIRHLAAAHRQAYRSIHRQLPAAQVGVAHYTMATRPARSEHWADRQLAAGLRWAINHRFLRLTKGSHNFIGVNYYFSRQVRLAGFPPKISDTPWSGATSDMGWPIDPSGLTDVVVDMKRYGLPIYVTENGLADATDSRRADFIRAHLRAVEAAQRAGSDVRGYFYWSLLDNFEWAHGFEPQFGLIAVNRATQARHVRPSAQVYKAIIESAK